jgi:hypothetical protein
MPEFLVKYPDVSIDLHLSDAMVDIIGDGFNARSASPHYPIHRSLRGGPVGCPGICLAHQAI